MPASSLNISLFEVCRDELKGRAPVVHCAKSTLTDLSRRLENFVLKRQIPALLCEALDWQKEAQQHQALVQVARQICVFTGEAPSELETQPLYIELGSDDPLRREWFVVIQSAHFAALLLGRAMPAPADNEPDGPEQRFETLWSFEPDMVDRALNVLESVVGHYAPDRLALLNAARAACPLVLPDLALIASLMTEMLQAVDQLRGALGKAADETQVKALARFPDENPDPVLHIGKAGIVLYSNEAGLHLLKAWDCQLGALLPANWCEFAARVLEENLRRTAEVQYENRYYDLEFVPVANTQNINIYGHNITKRKQLEAMMHESEVYYRTLVNTSPDGIILADPNGDIKFASPTAYRIFGIPLEGDIVGTSLRRWIVPEHYPIFADRRQKLAANQSVPSFEYQLVKYDGALFWGEFTSSSLTDAQGQVKAVMTVVRDITERKQMQEALYQSEQKFRSIVEQSVDGIALTDEQGIIRVWNQSYEQIMGLKRDEVVGRPLWDVQYQLRPDPENTTDVHERIKGMILEVLRTGQAPWLNRVMEQDFVRADGVRRIVQSMASVIKTDKGYMIPSIARDITESKATEQALRESEERYRLIADNMSDMIWLMDMNLAVTYISPSVERTRGFTLAELQALPLDKQLTPSSLEIATWAIAQELTPERLTQKDRAISRSLELEFYRKDGSTFWSENTLALIRDAEGQPVCILGVARDITERRRTEVALDRERNLLRTLIDLLPDRIYAKDTQTRFIIKNETDARQMGAQSTEEVVGKTDFDYYPSDIATGYYADDMAVIQSGQLLMDREEPTLDAEGNRRLILTTKVPLRNDQGQVIGLVGIGRDITERKRMEEAVRAERDRAQRYLDVAGVMLVALNVDQTIALINRKGCEILGYTEEEIIGKHWSDLVLPARIHDEIQEAFSRLVTGEAEEVEYYENPIVTRSGEERIIAWHNVLLTDAAGRITGTLSSGEDITERKKAEAALHRWAHIFEHAEWGVAVSGPDGQSLELMNQAFARMHDHTVEELTGKRLAEVFAPESQFALPERIRMAQVRGHHTFESKHIRKDGSYFPVLVNVTAVKDETDRVLYHVVNIQDITERKQAEDAEHEQRMLAEALHDTAAALNSTLNLEEVLDRILVNLDRVVPHTTADIMFVESGVARIVRVRGYAARVPDAWVQDSRFVVSELPILRRMAATGEPYAAPDTHVEPDWVVSEETRWMRSYAGAPIQIKGEVVGFLNLTATMPGFFTQKHADQLKTFVDQAAVAITNARLYDTLRQYTVELEQRVEQRTAELLRAKDHAETILNNSSDAIIVAWEDGLINQTNPAFRELFGYEGDEAFRLSLLAIVDPASAETLGHILSDMLKSGQPARIELVAWRKDGSTFDAELALAPIRDKQKADIVCNLRDITPRKQMEQKLRKMLEQERELNELKSRFVSTVSHEFRTPLTVILSSASLVKSYGHRLTEEQKLDQLEKIQSSVQHMVSLLEDVLTISRADSGKLKFEPTQLNLEQFCEHLIDDMQLMTGETHRIAFSPAGNCADMLMDGQLLRQILTNLLSNAIKYSPRGSTIHFDIRCDEQQVVLRLQDEGIGIPPDDQKHIFESFFRAKNAGNIVGTGLGLTIARRAAELHGGTIAFESSVGFGTTFTVTLPRSK